MDYNNIGCLAQLVERVPFKDDVAGSIPAAPTSTHHISKKHFLNLLLKNDDDLLLCIQRRFEKQIAGVLKVQLKSWDRPGKKLRAFFVGLIHLKDWGFDFQLVPPDIRSTALKRGGRNVFRR